MLRLPLHVHGAPRLLAGGQNVGRRSALTYPGVVREASAGAEEGSSDPRRSTYDRGYWLRRCDGFRVETRAKRVGRVAGVRYGERSNEPAILEVRAGFLGCKLMLIRVEDVSEIAPESRRVILCDRGGGRP